MKKSSLRHKSAAAHRRAGFTLVELLRVFGLGTLLATIMQVASQALNL